MLLLIAQAAVSSATPAWPSPPVETPTSARPMVVATFVPDHERLAREAKLRERVRIGVTFRTPQGIIWSGNLRVHAERGASWRQSESEAQEPRCAEVEWSSGTTQSEAMVMLRRIVDDESGNMVSDEAKWTRPDVDACASARSVELRQTVALALGATQTLKGDGGLVVELRRR